MKFFNKTLNKILAVTVFSIISIGCADINLEENPQGFLSPTNFYNTEADFDAALAGAYRPLYADWEGFDYAFPLIMTSGAEDVRSDAGIYKNFNKLSPNAGEPVIKTVWGVLYRSIANANAIIGNLGNAKGVSAQRLGEIEGQAKFIRAFDFFLLVRWFGQVQLTTYENQGNINTLRQSSEQEIYNSIIADLQSAEDKLPLTFADRGRPTKGAAKALLAKVYLTMAGWPIKDQSKYQLAMTKAKEVMDLGVYSLEPNFADLWKSQNRLTNKEFIFAFYGSIANNGISGSHMHTASRHWGNGEGGWGDFHSEDRFFNAFPNGPRKDATFTSVFADGTTWQQAEVQPYTAKFRDAGNTVALNGEGFNVMLRYADVLLMYAEAANMSNGSPTAAALDAINQVRRRAQGLPVNTPNAAVDLPSGMSKTDFDNAVLAERNWELAFEMNRWFDLVRREKVVEVNQALFPNVKPTNALLPKPSAQLIPGILDQNAGY